MKNKELKRLSEMTITEEMEVLKDKRGFLCENCDKKGKVTYFRRGYCQKHYEKQAPKT